MKGQWIGRFEGTNGGLVMLDLDDEGEHYKGHAFAFDDDPDLPSFVLSVVTPDTKSEQNLDITEIGVIAPRSTSYFSPAQFRQQIPKFRFQEA